MKPECQNNHPMHTGYPASRWLSVSKLADGSYHCSACDCQVTSDNPKYSWGQMHSVATNRH